MLNYHSLQNIMPLVWAAAYFAAVLLDTTSKLKVMAGYVLKAAKQGIRHTRVSLLLHCRWSDKHLYALSGTDYEVADKGYGAGVPIPVQRLKKMGELLKRTAS